MIITHITTVHSRYDVRIFRKECVSLAEAGYTVNLVVADGKGDEMKNGVRIIDAGARPTGRMKRMVNTVRQAYSKAITTNAHMYHLHDPELLTLIPRLLQKGKVVYDAHEDLPRQIMTKHWIPGPLRSIVSLLSERVENHYARKASGIITATPFIKERFSKVHPNVKNINNYPLLEEFRAIERRPSEENVACYIGGISAARGLYEMVRAMESVDGKLLLAGTFADPKERAHAASLPGWNKVVELGLCDREKVREIVAVARTGLVLFLPEPNHINAQPNKLFEYMAAGLPVIASDFPLWREIIESARCGLCVDPLAPETIANALRWILNHKEQARTMGERGKKVVLEEYNWAIEEKKLIGFYHKLSGYRTSKAAE